MKPHVWPLSPRAQYRNIIRWYDALVGLPAWQAWMKSVTAFMQTMEVSR